MNTAFKALLLATLACSAFFRIALAEEAIKPIKTMLLTGQSNKYHNWKVSSAAIERYLQETGLFEVDVILTPPGGESMQGFSPDWSKYQVVVMDYEGAEWPEETKHSFVEYMKNGGGLVTIHAADNSFPLWAEFNKMIGVGGWGGSGLHEPPLSDKPKFQASRNERWGPRIYWRSCEVVHDQSPGAAGHPPPHEWLLTVRNSEHPVTEGLPEVWLNGRDELYSGLRGPAENLDLLATGFADPDQRGASPHNEPVFMAISYGEGRVFHSTLGHVGAGDDSNAPAINNVAYIVSLQRGTEWAATGDVTQAVPEDFPTAYRSSYRKGE
ncbi:ThuA domain-containing protein [Pelagicoccus albus]|uniref:ThuA domain-containing protein n=1 Tax=Pelagicoccus albus TaxID=415222 RepID=A0A7X1E7I8_9BACT|nr:ThuA domain-containing protein [Pelagicoccus albus]MBC2605241.1 ThuA domain-containing protein [Pelagicoccus albus]